MSATKEDELVKRLKGVRIAVLMGGFSAEREVSLCSGQAMYNALKEAGCRVEAVDVKDDRFVPPDDIDVAVLALHGTGGEDGWMQELLEKKGIPFSGSDSASSRVAFNKVEAKGVFRRAGLLTPRDVALKRGECEKRLPANSGVGLPCVIKPARQGSSVGISIVRNEEHFQPALEKAFQQDEVILVEEFIEGGEYTVGIMGDEALAVVEIRPKSGWYDYTNKYTKNATEYLMPAPIDENLTAQLRDLALRAHHSLGCRDVSRVDFRVNDRRECHVLEVNSLPGMTETSLLPKSAAVMGISFTQLCLVLTERAFSRKKGKAEHEDL
ncbi:MAG: D-alanine--D-alanine ligase [Verrucomicrobiae bacterium]|nr:D-alanine--D-alanine ligase [Verrucomicrobiae bacterium]